MIILILLATQTFCAYSGAFTNTGRTPVVNPTRRFTNQIEKSDVVCPCFFPFQKFWPGDKILYWRRKAPTHGFGDTLLVINLASFWPYRNG